MPSQENVTFEKLSGGGSLILAWRVLGKRVLIVGGGVVAASRVVHAVQADAKVVVISQNICPEMQFRVDNGEVEWKKGNWTPEDLEDTAMVLAEGDIEGADKLYNLCIEKRIPVNVADIVNQCDFWFMSAHRDGPLQIAVSSNGKAPRLAHRLRKEIAAALPTNAGLAMCQFGKLRKEIRRIDPEPQSSSKRMRWLSELADKWTLDQIQLIDETIYNNILVCYTKNVVPKFQELFDVNNIDIIPPNYNVVQKHIANESNQQKGTLILVGAGPGDPDLLTVAGLREIQKADLIVSDRLVSDEILALAKGIVKVAPLKKSGASDFVQDQLNNWVLEGLNNGLRVVRLKVGDPFLFGRAGEELSFFANHGFSATAIPGISSALGAPSAALLPVTHRGLCDQVLILSGFGKGGVLPKFDTYNPSRTLIILMAVSRADAIQSELLSLNYPNDLPCTFVESYSLPNQRVTHTVLDHLSSTVNQTNISAPACLYIGRTSDFVNHLDIATSLPSLKSLNIEVPIISNH